MSKSAILSAIRKKTTDAIKNFVPVAGQSITKVIAIVGAKEAGVNATDVHNDKFNGEHGGAWFAIVTPTVKEVHWFVKRSALLEYIIVRTNLSNVQEKETLESVYTQQMPQMPKDGWSVHGGGEASSSQ